MRAFAPFAILLSLALQTPVEPFVLQRVSPAKSNVCHYYENPSFIALRAPPVQSRSPFFFADNPPNTEHIMRNINYGYLDMNKPITSMRDFVEMDSEEIGTRSRPKQEHFVEEKPELWRMEDVQAYAGGPQVLPDVVIAPEGPQAQTNHASTLTEAEKQMGRSVVVDSPPQPREDIIQQDKFLTYEADDMGDDEIEERYLNEPINHQYQPPSVVYNKIVKATEKEVPREYLEQYYRQILEPPVFTSNEDNSTEKTPGDPSKDVVNPGETTYSLGEILNTLNTSPVTEKLVEATTKSSSPVVCSTSKIQKVEPAGKQKAAAGKPRGNKRVQKPKRRRNKKGKGEEAKKDVVNKGN